MRRTMKKLAMITLALLLGWQVGGLVNPVQAVTETHAPAAEHAEAADHGAHGHDPAAEAVANLRPDEPQFWLTPMVGVVIGLFVAAAGIGPYVVRFKGHEPTEDSAAHHH